MSAEQEFSKKVFWKVPNITKEFLSSEEAKRAICSKKFSVFFGKEFTEWQLELRLAYTATNDVGLFLHLVRSSTFSFQSGVSLGIFNAKTKYELSRSFNWRGKEFGAVENSQNRNWGFPSLIKHETFLKMFDEFVANGAITVVCELKIQPEQETTDVLQSCSSNFSDMFQNNFLADFELVIKNEGVKKESFKCHKIVLAQKSEVFKRKFKYGHKKAKVVKYEICDLKASLIKELLRFMYCGNVEGLDGIAPELILAAEKYEMKELKDLCIGNIMSNLNADNVIGVLKMIDSIPETDQVVLKGIEVINDNYHSISQKDEWKNLPQPLLWKISDLVFKESGGSSLKFI